MEKLQMAGNRKEASYRQAKSLGNWRLKDKMEQYKQEFIEFSVMVSFSLLRMPIFLVFQGFDRF